MALEINTVSVSEAPTKQAEKTKTKKVGTPKLPPPPTGVPDDSSQEKPKKTGHGVGQIIGRGIVSAVFALEVIPAAATQGTSGEALTWPSVGHSITHPYDFIQNINKMFTKDPQNWANREAPASPNTKNFPVPAEFIVDNKVQKATVNIEAGINAVPATPEEISAIINKGIPILPKDANSVNSPKMPLLFSLKLKSGQDVQFKVNRPMISEKLDGPIMGMSAGTFSLTLLNGEAEVIMSIPTNSTVKAYRMYHTIDSGPDAGKDVLNGIDLEFDDHGTHYVMLVSIQSPTGIDPADNIKSAPVIGNNFSLSNDGNGVVVKPEDVIMKMSANANNDPEYSPSIGIMIFAVDSKGKRIFVEGDFPKNADNQLLYSPAN
jgi:hypothetical protein